MAIDYYVSPSGSDSNPGSKAAPFATIQAASKAATPGTTVHVAPGTYTTQLITAASGTANAHIRYVSTVEHEAVIKVATPKVKAIWKNTGSYVDIEGFEIVGTDGATLGLHNNASHVRIVGNKIHDIRDLTGSNSGGAGIVLEGYWNIDNDVIGNEIYNIGYGSPTKKTYFQGLYLSDNGGVVQDNYIHDNLGRAVQTNHGAQNKIITHNLLTNSYDGIVIANWDGPVNIPAAGFTVSDNIIIGSRNWAIIEDTNTGANRYVGNQLYDNNNQQYYNGVFLKAGHGSTQTETKIMDAATANSVRETWGLDGSGSNPTPAPTPEITGTDSADTLKGTSGADVIKGLSGSDVLSGGAGNDKLTGGLGKDAFVFDTTLSASSNVDTLTDFSLPGDSIRLENSIFTKIGATGTLASSAFYKGSAAHDSTDRIIYNSSTGTLSYDADGNGSGAAVKFAQLAKGLVITYADFLVI